MIKSAKCLLNSGFFHTQHAQNCVLFILIFICVTNIRNGACVIPEASQEGPLRSFESYDDVVMFHYNVPKQVLRATWQFSAFTDNSKCPQRKVNIFLKWGSYPVIVPNNATYPHNMYIDNNHTVQISAVTAFEPKSMVLLPIYGPEPGDWFVGAYLSPWDQDVHQKGLGHECHYTLGSVAIWSETTGLLNIPLNYQKTIKTAETISYYKIYIPSDTWSFQVDIWGCNFTIKIPPHFHDFRETCIKNLALRGRALPYYNHSNPSSIGNLTTMDSYTFSEFSPFQDEWYYLMVVSSSAITFNIKVTTFDCPLRTMEEVFINRMLDIPLYSKAFNEFHMKSLKEKVLQYSINVSEVYKEPKLENINESSLENSNNLSSCIPRYELARIKYPKMFSGDYLLRSGEWLTSWLTLTDTYPVIAQFDILPLVDIGGTLNFNLTLEMDKNLSKQQVDVAVCINRGNIPKQEDGHIKCDNKHMVIELSNNGTFNASLLIPYPQPDIWYIAFQAVCYVNSQPVHCEMEHILVSLNVKLQACVFEENNSCGQYGVCEEIHKGLLYYTACKCFGGREGWGCTDASNAVSEFFLLFGTLSLTLSNLFFIPAMYVAYKRKFYTEGLIYFSTMLFSAMYHVCDQQFTSYCIAKYEVLQYCDFFSGILAFWVTLVAMAGIPVKYESFFHMLGVIIITCGVQIDKTGLSSTLIPMIIGGSLPLMSYGLYCYKMKKIMIPKRIVKLIIGLLLAVIGILLYSFIETESNYQFVHSAWHVIIALSLIFLLPTTREDQILTNQLANELLNHNAESPEESLLSIDSIIQQSNHLVTDVS